MSNHPITPPIYRGYALKTARDLNAFITRHPNFGCSLAHIATGSSVKCTDCPFGIHPDDDCIFEGGRRFKDWRKTLIYGFQAGIRWADKCRK